VWRKIHILRPVPSFVVASASSAILALPFAVNSVSRNETAMFRDLFWPHQFNPFLTFAVVFLALLPVLLAYYHLGRAGLMVSTLAAMGTGFVMTISTVLIMLGWLGVLAYTAIGLLVYLLLFVAHMKAAKSRSIRDAQRVLHLVPSRQSAGV
jgi:cation transport ATPase